MAKSIGGLTNTLTAATASATAAYLPVEQTSTSYKMTLRELRKATVDVFNVVDYGATGDGSTDDTTFIQAALDAMSTNGGGKVIFPGAKTYLLTSRLEILNDDDWQIDLCGSTLKMDDESPVTADYCIFDIRNCERFSISNGTLDGNVSGGGGRTPAQLPAHSLYLRDVKYFTLENLLLQNSPVDGIYLSATDDQDVATFSRHGQIVNCIADGNSRQGISIINAYDIEVRGGAYINTDGLLPQAGINIERNNTIVDGTPSCRSIRIIDARFEDNTGEGIKVVDDADDTIISGCFFSGNSKGMKCEGNVQILHSRFEGTATDGNGMVQLASPDGNSMGGRGAKIVGNNFVGPCADEAINISGAYSAEPVEVSGNFIHGYTGAIVTYETTNIANNRISECGGTVITLQSGASNSIVQGNIFLDTPSTQQMFYVNGSSNVVITGNVFTNCAATYVVRGITGTNCLFSGNILTRSDSTGYIERNDAGCVWKFNNNLVSGYATDPFYSSAVHYEYNAYTVTNDTTDRSLDANGTLDQVADVLGTLINDLKKQGIIS